MIEHHGTGKMEREIERIIQEYIWDKQKQGEYNINILEIYVETGIPTDVIKQVLEKFKEISSKDVDIELEKQQKWINEYYDEQEESDE